MLVSLTLPPADPRLACDQARWLPAEASTRRYARLVGGRAAAGAPAGDGDQAGDSDQASVVLMVFADGTPAAEVRRVERATALLAAGGVPVPLTLETDATAGWILQEDLGDVTLADVPSAPSTVRRHYDEALEIIAVIAALRVDTSPEPPLSAARLARELELFAEHALPPMGPVRARELGDDLGRLIARCAGAPRALCHRDYHARNLLVHADRVRVVDHQDALVGPACYDHVSLAYDPYVELPDVVRDAIAVHAVDSTPPETIAAVAVQRLAKAVGTYALHRGPWSRYIVPAARQARRLAARHDLALPTLDDALAELIAGSAGAPDHPASGDGVRP